MKWVFILQWALFYCINFDVKLTVLSPGTVFLCRAESNRQVLVSSVLLSIWVKLCMNGLGVTVFSSSSSFLTHYLIKLRLVWHCRIHTIYLHRLVLYILLYLYLFSPQNRMKSSPCLNTNKVYIHGKCREVMVLDATFNNISVI